jgi:hypothetical protein
MNKPDPVVQSEKFDSGINQQLLPLIQAVTATFYEYDAPQLNSLQQLA